MYRVFFGFALLVVILAVAHQARESDVWQHLRVGSVLWETHSIPKTNIWTWPTYGDPYEVKSWLFCAALWPLWSSLGERGLDLWRWSTAIILFLLLLKAARSAGKGIGDGLPTLAVLAWSSLLWRQRWECRPETLASLLLVCSLWLLEHRRTRPKPRQAWRDPIWWYVPLQVVWINAHISYYLGLFVLGAFLLDELMRRARGDGEAYPARMMAVLGVATLACLINPYGLRGVLQPFEFFLHTRNEPIFKTVDELQPLNWLENLRNGLPLYLTLLVGSAVLRWRRESFDPAQAALLALLLPEAIFTNRFLGMFAVATAPMFARDLEYHLGGATLPSRIRSGWLRVAVLAIPLTSIAILEYTRVRPAFGLGIRQDRVPVRAMDYIAERGIRGRGYNVYWNGGYILYRSWPDRERLPFMDIHQTGHREDRDLQVFAMTDTAAWNALDSRWRFDWVVLPTVQPAGHHLVDWLDTQSRQWALVFADDAASLYVRRDGRCSAVAESDAYRFLRLGNAGYVVLQFAALRDSVLREGLLHELDRAVAASGYDSRARSMRASLEMMESRWSDARADLEAALRISPGLERGYDRLALALIMEGRASEAAAAIRTGRRLGVMDKAAADQLEAQARQAMSPHAPGVPAK